MTAKHVVADDVLGKVTRRMWELSRRILEGSVDTDRAQFFLRLALEGVPRTPAGGDRFRMYLLESRWAWDNSHVEYATIKIEFGDRYGWFEDLLDSSVSDEDKSNLIEMLKRIYKAQVPQHGSHRPVRLFRLVCSDFFGYAPNTGLTGSLERDTVDMHMVLTPVCDFKKDFTPIAPQGI